MMPTDDAGKREPFVQLSVAYLREMMLAVGGPSGAIIEHIIAGTCGHPRRPAVALDTAFRKGVAERFGITLEAVRSAVFRLVSMGVILRTEDGLYAINEEFQAPASPSGRPDRRRDRFTTETVDEAKTAEKRFTTETDRFTTETPRFSAETDRFTTETVSPPLNRKRENLRRERGETPPPLIGDHPPRKQPTAEESAAIRACIEHAANVTGGNFKIEKRVADWLRMDGWRPDWLRAALSVARDRGKAHVWQYVQNIYRDYEANDGPPVSEAVKAGVVKPSEIKSTGYGGSGAVAGPPVLTPEQRAEAEADRAKLARMREAQRAMAAAHTQEKAS